MGRAEGRIRRWAAVFRHRCSAEASAARQFRYVAGLLASTAFVQTWAEVGPLPYAWHVWCTAKVMTVVARMIGMCLGWALGNAFKAICLQNRHTSRARVRQSLT